MVISIVALVVALGGAGYAALRLPDASVGTSQLKDGAVVARKVRLHTLLAVDFKPGQVPRGPTGSAGRPGPPGSPGTARAFGAVHGTGTLDPTRSKDIAAVTHPAVGVYCIALAAGINAASTTIVATPDEADPTSTSKAVAHVDSRPRDCSAGQLEVVMRHFAIAIVGGTPTLVDHHVDNSFSFVVP